MLLNTYGYVREISKDVEDTREVEFIISSSTRDRHRSVLNMDGWQLDNYNRNPIVGYMHNVYGDDLCGKDDPDDVIGSGRAWLDDHEGQRVLKGAVKFETHDVNPKAEKIFRKVLAGTLRATSVGFMELGKGETREVKNERGEKEKTYYFSGQELLEFSIVKIPSNPRAIKLNVEDRKILNFIQRYMPEDISVKQLKEMRVADVLDLIEGKKLKTQEQTEEVKTNLNYFARKHQLTKNRLSTIIN